jgi:hypothetical protein
MRILCLHGYTQNDALFRRKTGALRSEFKDIEFVYALGPILLEPATGDDEEKRAWFTMKKDYSVYDGYQESMQYLAR